MQERPRLGISACLLGQPVRFDGGHKHDAFLADALGKWVDWVPVCPEVGSGLSVPRPTLRLVGEGMSPPRLIAPKTGLDHTEAMARFSAQEIARLCGLNLSGFVLKSKSPSCGMERVKIYRRGMPTRAGAGLFAAALMEALPWLPVEEEGRLHDERLREHFLERVFALKRWQAWLAAGPTRHGLVAFHAAHKYLLLAHSPEHYRKMGLVVAAMKGQSMAAVCATYEALFLEGMRRRATAHKHVNVLQHMLGFFKRDLDSTSRADILHVINDFRAGLVPLAVPMTLLRHHVRALHVEYLAGQLYFEPTPKELR